MEKFREMMEADSTYYDRNKSRIGQHPLNDKGEELTQHILISVNKNNWAVVLDGDDLIEFAPNGKRSDSITIDKNARRLLGKY